MAITLTRPESGVHAGGMEGPPDPEVGGKAKRRRFSVAYKLSVVEEADLCTKPGEVGALLRREGLYSSHLTAWRRQRREGTLGVGHRRGRRATDPLQVEVERLQAENQRLRHRLEQAEVVIEMQKKISGLLGIGQATGEENRK